MDEALWLVAGVVLVLVEVFTLTIAAGMVGVGALAAALAAWLGAPFALQAGVFVVTSAGLLAVRRPVQRALERGAPGADVDPRALSGSTATVVERVSDTTGQVRLHGELWRARPYAGTGPVEAGAPVTVAAVDGATLLVYSPDLS